MRGGGCVERLFRELADALPRGKGAVLFFVAFLFFYVEHFNVFGNPRVMLLCTGEEWKSNAGLSPLAVIVTCCAFFVLMLFYLRNKFSVSRGMGLVASCALIACVPLYWFFGALMAWGSSFLAGCVVLGLYSFGHLCFLPVIVKHLAMAGPMKSLFFYAAVLVCEKAIRPLLLGMPAAALGVWIAATPVVVLLCARSAERLVPVKVELKTNFRTRIPKVLLVTLVVVGVLMGLFSQLESGVVRPPAASVAEAVVAAGIIVLVFFTTRLNFNRLFYLISMPLMIYGIAVLADRGSPFGLFGFLVFNFGYDFFYATLWSLYSYLVRYSTFNYYWLPVAGAFGSYLGRALGIVYFEACGGGFAFGVEGAYWLAIASVLFAATLVAISFYGRNNMKSGWGSVSPHEGSYDASGFDAGCNAVAAMGGLTAREKNVFVLLAKGNNNKAIAEKLGISPATAKTHIKHIYSKLGVHSQQELIDMVEQNGRQARGSAGLLSL